MNLRTKAVMKNVLLTGATGVLGGRLLQEILSTTGAYVYCVVRANSHELAARRIEDVLFAYDEHQALRNETWRIVPVLGDVSKKNLGLSADTYDELARSVDFVLHCAANVSLVASYGKIAPVNVDGTAHVVEFCLSGNIPLLFTSSFSMLGDKLFHEGFVLRERDLDVGQGFDDLDYERSKFEAEKIVHAAGARGLDWVIVRPGNIWGDSVTGCYPLQQTKVRGIYYEMIKSLVETGITFSSGEDFDVTPVDYVAKAGLHAITNLPAANRRTFNLTNPNPITYDGIVERLRDFGYTVRNIDSQVYFEALREGRIRRDGELYRSIFTDLLSIFADGPDADEVAKYDTSEITALLSGTGIACHPTDAALMSRYLAYAIRTGFIAEPRAQAPLAQIAAATAGGGLMERLYDADLRDAAVLDT